MTAELDERSAFNALLRQDFVFFAQRSFETLHPGADYEHNWHIEAMAAALRDAQEGRTRRLLITLPPRHMKSLCVSVAWVAFLLGHDPTLRIILVSYGQELSGANLRLLRTVLESDWYREIFPDTRLASAKQIMLTTDRSGSVRALSSGGVFTGFGADYIIYDDPMKQSDAQSAVEREKVLNFYQGTVLTRQNDPQTARIVIVMQRVHEDDLAGHAAASGQYQVLCLPAEAEEVSEHSLYHGGVQRRAPGGLLWPERFPKAVLEERRREMGDYEYALQFQQNPIPLGGGLVRIDEIQRHDVAPRREQCRMVIQSIDTAMTDGPKSDFTVIMTFGYHDAAWRLLDVQRRRLRWPDMLGLVRAERHRWQPDVILIEHAGSGIPLFQELKQSWNNARRTTYPNWKVMPYQPSCGKHERFAAQAARLKDGFVTFPTQADWLHDALREIAAFPGGAHDDQVDALSQFIDFAARMGDPGSYGQRPAGRTRPPGRPHRQAFMA